VLIIEGQRFHGISFAVERNGEPQVFGFLSGPLEILRKARTACTVELELEGGTRLAATVLEVNPSGMALVAIDPKQLPRSQQI
jgi:hypothetical protein